jgi:DNA transformation protein
MQSDLLRLKNLGNTSVNWLHTIGVNSHQDLVNIGPVEAYHLIRQRDIKVSKVFLYALQGALTDTHWNDLDPAVKKQLLEQAELRRSLTDPA